MSIWEAGRLDFPSRASAGFRYSIFHSNISMQLEWYKLYASSWCWSCALAPRISKPGFGRRSVSNRYPIALQMTQATSMYSKKCFVSESLLLFVWTFGPGPELQEILASHSCFVPICTMDVVGNDSLICFRSKANHASKRSGKDRQWIKKPLLIPSSIANEAWLQLSRGILEMLSSGHKFTSRLQTLKKPTLCAGSVPSFQWSRHLFEGCCQARWKPSDRWKPITETTVGHSCLQQKFVMRWSSLLTGTPS